MKKISKKTIKIIEKHDNIDEIPQKDWEYISKQINRLYTDFTIDSNIWDIKITKKPSGEFQQDGQYCSQLATGEYGDYFTGVYYFPTTDGRYLAVNYDC